VKGGPNVRARSSVQLWPAVILPAVLVLSSGSAAAQPSPDVAGATAPLVLSLPESVEIALEKNLLLKVAWNEVELAAAGSRIEEASFAPWISLAASHTETVISRQREITGPDRDQPDEDLSRIAGSFVRSFRHGGILSLTTDLTESHVSVVDGEELPEWGHGVGATYSLPLLERFGMDVTTANLRRSEIDYQRSLLEYERSVKELIVGVVASYYTAQQSRLLIEERSLAVERAKEQLRAARIRQEEGEVAPLDVFRSELQLRRNESPLILSRRALKDSLNFLRLLIGLDPSRSIQIAVEEVAYVTEEVSMAEASQHAVAHRTDLRVASLELEDAEIELTVTRNALLPDLSVAAGVSFRDFDDEFEDIFTYADTSVGVGLFFQMPLGGGRIGELERYRQAKLRVNNARLLLEQTRREVITEVEDAVREVETLEEDITTLEAAVDVAQQTYELSQTAYDGGLITAFDLSQAQDNLTSVRTELVEALMDHRIAVARLDLAMGRGVDDLLLRVIGPEATWTPPATEDEE
jgi:outer membrane protein